jgi:hypothetical protein
MWKDFEAKEASSVEPLIAYPLRGSNAGSPSRDFNDTRKNDRPKMLFEKCGVDRITGRGEWKARLRRWRCGSPAPNQLSEALNWMKRNVS